MFVALDFETADYKADSACAVGLVRIDGAQVGETLYRLIRPPRSRVFFTHIHGLTWAMLRDEPTFAEVWPEMAAFMEGAQGLIAHNATFDSRVLAASCVANGFAPPELPFYCTLKGARRGLGLARNGLNDVCGHLGFELEHHNAASDALAAAKIFVHLTQTGETPLPLERLKAGKS